MIIDAHTHIGKKHIVASASDLVASMNKAGIDKSLVFAGKINEQATDILLNDIEPFKGRLYGIGSVSLSSGNDTFGLGSLFNQIEHRPGGRIYNYLEDMFVTQQIFGLKFYVGYEHYYPNTSELSDIYKLLIKYDKPAIFHSGDCYNGVCGAKLKYAHPLHIDDLATDYPKLKIIIAHMGYPWVLDAAEVCYKNANVYADTSGFVYGAFKEHDIESYRQVTSDFIRISGGTNKLIFGTDWPISEQQSYVDVIHKLFKYGLKSEEYEAILGTRAAELFGIV